MKLTVILILLMLTILGLTAENVFQLRINQAQISINQSQAEINKSLLTRIEYLERR